MTAREASERIRAFLASGRAGTITLHVAAPGEPSKKGVIVTAEICERLPIARSEDGTQILDMLAKGA